MITLWFLIALQPLPPYPGFTMPRMTVTSYQVFPSESSCKNARDGKGMFRDLAPLLDEDGNKPQSACVKMRFPKWMLEPPKPEEVCPKNQKKPCVVTERSR